MCFGVVQIEQDTHGTTRGHADHPFTYDNEWFHRQISVEHCRRNTDSIVLPQVLQATVLQTLGTVQIGDVMVMIVEVSIGGKLWFSKKTMSYRILHIVTY